MDFVQVRLPRAKYLALRELDPRFGEETTEDHGLRDWTYEDFLDHMVGHQGLQAKSCMGVSSTGENRVRYARFLENYKECPVELRPPSEKSWVRHMAYRRANESLPATAVEQYRRTMVSLLRFLGIPRWESLMRAPRATRKKRLRLPPRELVRLFWTEIPCRFRYRRKVIELANLLTFNVGLAPPAEVCGLMLDDVEWDSKTIVGRRPKKWGEERVIYGVDSEVFERLQDYVDVGRPRSNRPEMLVTASGTRWSPPRLGGIMGDAGRLIWAGYRPYTGRRWFINERLRRGEYKNVYEVAQLTGASVKVLLEHYVDHAAARRNLEYRSVR